MRTDDISKRKVSKYGKVQMNARLDPEIMERLYRAAVMKYGKRRMVSKYLEDILDEHLPE